ncbi:hypothetical protein [Qipengyuania spongiae]|uniref:Uncharacterized protein n=1 Tax=Qipengyuania spongiae TaxID=2909673 RepID=A0ABY5T218_9SPHN|nr:hypothetical protein [Qipengyuania spongiae]UVI40460.1 hypothetical protein L1F33_05820 [Qipengyuania spongiae]
MTTIGKSTGQSPVKWKKTLFAVGLGGVSGFLAAMAFLRMGDGGLLGRLGPSEEIAALVGLVYLLSGFAIGVGLVAPKAGATFLNVEDAEEIAEQRVSLTCSTIAMILLGVQLMVAALAAPVGIIPPGTVLAVFIVASVAIAVLSWRSYRHQDELMRAIGRQASAAAFYLTLIVGGLWALLGHLDYMPAPAPLDWLTMIWSFVLLGAFITVARNGMLKMR